MPIGDGPFIRPFKLCPFVEITNEEGEGDATTSATLSTIDSSDAWKMVLRVPAILGFVAQDHIFGIVSSGGDYGCDVSVEVLEQ